LKLEIRLPNGNNLFTVTNMARSAGVFHLYHGHAPDNEKKVCVVLNCLSEAHMQKFMAATGEDIAASGHILESTVTEMYVN
jgi:hypothetical protein